ncbi:MAG: bifunctional adenosylcobinamide kinase/adenosylcobinamide-phosphate guanylyltransferase [Bacterioplanes sp.]|nr:bifunctional adenosylcobinamide kinase/adenosylcobinamide-phosphate guanylyltransferase [Bacterioplanes sp.]
MGRIELILGGARSGKSRYAEQQLLQAGTDVIYIATAQALDGEMQQRIQRHQQQRPAHWRTIEQPIALADAIQQVSTSDPNAAILVDCLTLWVTNCLLADGDCWSSQKDALLRLLPQLTQPLWLVSNEVGHGIVPLGELSRRFVDESGWLHQAIAAQADGVTLMVAGIPMFVKSHATHRQLGSIRSKQ